MKHPKGFIQVPILIAIIASLLVVSGGSYFGVKQYQNYQEEQRQEQEQLLIAQEDTLKATQQEIERSRTENEEARETEIGALKQEVEDLKLQQNLKDAPPETSNNPERRNGNLTNAEIIKRVKPSVVFIQTQSASGTGMIIDPNGYILTNAHVVEDVSSAQIKLSNGQLLNGLVTGRDEDMDLAVLKIESSDLQVVVLGNSDQLEQGDEVFTLGYPFGIEGDVSFKEGTLSRKLSENNKTYLETSADIHPGNSGGPLVNKLAQVVGINTFIFGEKIGGVIAGESLKFALPINYVKNAIPDLKTGRNIVKEREITDEQQRQMALIENSVAETKDYLPTINALDNHQLHIVIHEQGPYARGKYAHIQAHKYMIKFYQEDPSVDPSIVGISTEQKREYYKEFFVRISKLIDVLLDI